MPYFFQSDTAPAEFLGYVAWLKSVQEVELLPAQVAHHTQYARTPVSVCVRALSTLNASNATGICTWARCEW